MARQINHSYFVVMIDLGRAGYEAVVQPEITQREVVSRVQSREYDRIAFIHYVHDGVAEDVTNDILSEAGFYEEAAEIIPLRADHPAQAEVKRIMEMVG